MNDISLVERVGESLVAASRTNLNDRIVPCAVLWVDPDRTWMSLLPQLRSKFPILSLGPYSPPDRQGPAIWIRAVVGGGVQTDCEERPWVIYLPGISRGDLRAIESCDAAVRPIAELQFRSTWWCQSNQSPWTPPAYLRSPEGVGLDLARDEATNGALALVLDRIGSTSVGDLQRRGRIDADYLTSLVSVDVTRTLLEWLNAPTSLKSRLDDQQWAAFMLQCKKTFDLDPVTAGAVSVAEHLGGRRGVWANAWGRFAEAPHSYPHIPDVLRQARPSGVLVTEHADSWPQENEDAEQSLRADLLKIGSHSAADARAALARLERDHGPRRESVWSTLRRTPLADALKHLAQIGNLTASLPSEESVDAFAEWYATQGWKVDAAVIDALSRVVEPAAREAVGSAVRALYLPWLDDVARRFQDVAVEAQRIGTTGLQTEVSDCVLFVDGLRYDVAERLRSKLSELGLDTTIAPRIAPFPTMTPCGKPAVAPITSPMGGGEGLNVVAAEKTVDAVYLRALLASNGVSPIPEGETGDPTGRGWTETGDLDSTGHKLALKLVDRIAPEVDLIASRVQELLAGGWKRVHVVTDHGWQLVPGSLPKVELALHLTSVRKSRCARLTDAAADVDQPTLQWTWDTTVRMVSPRGVAAFQSGCVYEHGGLSPQESVVPHMVVTNGSSVSAAIIEHVKWVNMRCRVDVMWAPPGAFVDLRRAAGDGAGSLVGVPSPLADDAEAKLLVEDDGLLGETAYVVLLSASGDILAQVSTRVGG